MEHPSNDDQCKSSVVVTYGNQVTDKVKERSRDQREPLPGEPKCVICNRYGEYICDQTDDDICSLECKQTVLCRVANTQLPVNLPPPKRLTATDECFYVRDSGSQSGSVFFSSDQTELLRSRLEIHVKGDLVPPPILSFSSCNFPQKLLQNIEAAGFEMPTPVQMQAIPAALSGKSLLVSAETGSGKTASFLVPIVYLCANFRFEQFRDRKKPLAMVLTPTRELCIQVEEQAKLLGKGLPFKTALVVGGDAMARQLHRIQQGVELIVGTPGRLIDLLTKNDIQLDDVKIFGLDEVDCMFQRGFRDQCDKNLKTDDDIMMNGTHSVGECSSSTSLSSQQDVEDDCMIAVVLSEEYAKLDGAVARRLSNLAPVPHIPRINSYIPNISDASLDHQRLLQRLHVYGLYEVKVSGDGNCQFRALSDQMYKSPEYHKHVRKEIVKQLKDYHSLYEGYVPMKYKRYYKKMAKSGEWGDHVTLQAAADKFEAKICLLTSFRDTCFIEIMPQYQPPKRELWLSFWSEVHYNSLYEIRDAPIQQKPRRKHWLF
ncbi:hypothetical protein PRUPE_3G315400 [Prunus persica]|uniref:DEAD-box ATP-dependent RNA helicase 41 n=2 Tax=Prunus persica TaxID=3760 RepID=A0A251Q8F4_PRUPE|nr:hypothetical protein PRUPE_3G315400 [Prunus persica]ONI20109.1 hypothetical protein PRUPE_3G315400 [Prunus persica]